MAHDHHHADESYYKEQLSTIALGGLFGGVCVMMWQQGKVEQILAENFQLPVLLGGLTLLGLVGARAVLVWLSAGQPAAPCHDHGGHDHHHEHEHDHPHEHVHADHGHDHLHEHDHAAHDHPHEHAHGHDHGSDDHDHDHGWGPWRYAVLLLPIVLFFLGLPPAPFLVVQAIAVGQPTKQAEEPSGKKNTLTVAGTVKSLDTQVITLTTDAGEKTYLLGQLLSVFVDGQKQQSTANVKPGSRVTLTLVKKFSGLSTDYILRQLVIRELENTDVDSAIAVRGDGVENLSFPVLEQAALYPDLRQALEGKMGRLRGQFMPGPSDRVAVMVRSKMTCCRADMRTLQVGVIAPESLGRYKPEDWVEVTGQIQFRKRKNRDAWLPVLQLRSPEQMQPTDPEPELN